MISEKNKDMNRVKRSIYIREKLWDDIDEKRLALANCTSKNEYVEDALQFYAEYLNLNGYANDFLPREIRHEIDGTLSTELRRINKYLYKNAVMNMAVIQAFVAAGRIDAANAEELIRKCEEDIQGINGRIGFDTILRDQRG